MENRETTDHAEVLRLLPPVDALLRSRNGEHIAAGNRCETFDGFGSRCDGCAAAGNTNENFKQINQRRRLFARKFI